MRSKKIVKIILLIAFVLCVFALSLFYINLQNPSCKGIPDGSFVVISRSSFSGYKPNNPKARSFLYFYNKNGQLLGVSDKKEEVMSGYIVQTELGLTCFYKNHTELIDNKGFEVLKNTSGIEQKAQKFTPVRSGYIEEMDLSFSLLNIGQKGNDDSYINILRFVSESDNYDVIIPYYLDSVSYDPVLQQFVCEISSLMETQYDFEYVLVKYNDITDKFEYEDEHYGINNEEIFNERVRDTTGFIVRDNIVQYISVLNEAPSDAGFYNPDLKARVALSCYDLNSQSIISNQWLTEPYVSGSYACLALGSCDTPFYIKDGEYIYLFMSTGITYNVDCYGNVKTINTDYQFDHTIVLASSYNAQVPSKAFMDDAIKVFNGDIYILTLTNDMIMHINKYIDDGYEEIWSAKLTDNWQSDLMIFDFEVLASN